VHVGVLYQKNNCVTQCSKVWFKSILIHRRLVIYTRALWYAFLKRE